MVISNREKSITNLSNKFRNKNSVYFKLIMLYNFFKSAAKLKFRISYNPWQQILAKHKENICKNVNP